MTYTGGFGVDTTGIDFGDTFLPGAGSPSYGTYDFLPRSQFPEDFYNTQNNSGGGFFNQAGQFVDSLGRLIPGVTNIAKAYQDIAGVGAQQSPGIFNEALTKKSLDTINKNRKDTEDQIALTFERIAGLTGKNIPGAVNEYIAAFNKYMPEAEQKGLTQIATPPEIAPEYGRLENRVANINKQYSTLSNPQYQAAYKAPDAIARINTQDIKDVMSFSPANRELYNYSNLQSQIYGRPDANANLAQFYAGNQAVNDLMSYG
jgi:hypothetical protein